MALIGFLAVAAGAAGWHAPAVAATTERVVADRFTGLAIGGIDPVAYFTERRVMVGSPDFELTQDGVVWRFRNADNRAFFLAHPEVYGPQFGGYDPVDVARGVAFAGRAQFWLIWGDRLYLFGHEDSRRSFAADPAGVLRQACDQWPELKATLAQ